MSTHTFLLTYSVSPIGTDHKAADVIRARIAKLDCHNRWIKLVGVETTFKGKIDLSYALLENQKKEIQDKITKIIKTVFDEKSKTFGVFIDVAILVDGMGEVIEFCIYG